MRLQLQFCPVLITVIALLISLLCSSAGIVAQQPATNVLRCTNLWTGAEATDSIGFSVAVPPSGGTGGPILTGVPDKERPPTLPPWFCNPPGAGCSSTLDTGKVELRNPCSSMVSRIYGTTPGGDFGHAVAYVGDLDNDGDEEFAVGAPGIGSGTVFVYSVSDLQNPLVTITSPSGSPTGSFGHSLAAVGASFAIGDPDAPGGGAVYLYGLTTAIAPVLVRTLTPPVAVLGFGSAIAGAGDVDTDGTPDVLVGASNSGGPGMAWIQSGATGSVIYTLSGPGAASDLFGYAVANLGDIDGNGRDDHAVGAPGANGNAGEVRVFLGETGALLYALNGVPGTADYLGAALAPAGDIDGDFDLEFIVGAPKFGNPPPPGERTEIREAATGLLIQTLASRGWAVAGGTDLDADGTPDVVVGDSAGNLMGLFGAPEIWYVDDDATAPFTGSSLDPFLTIQAAVTVAQSGDVIVVRAGTYNETVVINELNVHLVGESGHESTVIDAQGSGRPLTLTEVDAACVIEGFTLTSGNTSDGGGLFCAGSPRILDCKIAGNTASDGEQIYFEGGSFLQDPSTGSGLAEPFQPMNDHRPVLERCLIGDDSALGEAIFQAIGFPFNESEAWGGLGPLQTTTFERCTIVGDVATDTDPSFCGCTLTTNARFHNTIVDGSVEDGAELDYACVTTVLGSVACAPPQCLAADPDLAGPVAVAPLSAPVTGLYGLRPGSPCIDAADPASLPDPDGTPADIGAIPYQPIWPGTEFSTDAFVIETAVNSPTPTPSGSGLERKRAHPGDPIQMTFSSPNGQYAGCTLFVMGELLAPDQPLFAVPGVPGVHINPVFMAFMAGFPGAPFGPGPLFLTQAPVTIISFVTPAIPIPFDFSFQGLVIATDPLCTGTFVNGVFATTSAHVLQLRP